ncbi:MAG: class I SAM-dependent methyltransferase [Actinomycetota bacterium]|nr:class I SAM-dependent methyltransferase [Actinomycetota bacterium]
MSSLNRLVEDIDFVLEASSDDDVRALYDRAAHRYDHFRELWLRFAGGGAEQAMVGDLAEVVRRDADVLDAGCGTGALARRIRELEPHVALTMLDLSPEMLRMAGDVPGRRMIGSVLDLPFASDSFDVVVSAWVIETVSDPARAVEEFLRVLRPGGRILYTFCSLPDGWLSRAGSAWLRAAVRRGFAGDFIPIERAPYHDCTASHRLRFRGGLTTEVSLSSCCHVAPYVLPARP